MRWWIELKTLWPWRLALASLDFRLSIVALILAVPTAATGYFVMVPMLAERGALMRDQHQLAQQWRAAQGDVTDQRAALETTREEVAAVLRHWRGDLEETMLAVLASSVTDDRLTATVNTNWVQWLRWLRAVNGQPDVSVRLLDAHIEAADAEAETHTGTDSPVLQVALSLSAVPDPSTERSAWSTQAFERDPFAEVESADVVMTPKDPLSQMPLAQLNIAGVIRVQDRWEVLVTTRNLPLQRRGLGAALGVDGGVIASIDQRKVMLRRHAADYADQEPAEIELLVRRSEP